MKHSVKKEAALSLLFRLTGIGGAFVSNFVLIRQLSAAEYGVWATLTSLLVWVQLSDLGIGYTLKNRIASAEDPRGLLPLVAGAVQLYGLLALLLAAAFFVIGPSVRIFREHPVESAILCLGTVAYFPLTVSTAVLQGLRRNSTQSALSFVQTIGWLAVVLLLYGQLPQLWWLAVLYVALANALGIWQFRVALRQMGAAGGEVGRTIFGTGHLRLVLPLLRVSGQFVLLQLSSLTLFSLGTYLTYAYLTPSDAARYDIVFKFFQLPVTVFNIVLSVFWPEISRSLAQRNAPKLRAEFGQLWMLALLGSGATLVFARYIAAPLVAVYSGGKMQLGSQEALPFWALVTVQMCAYAGAVFLNAAERLRGQIVLAVAAAACLLPVVGLLHRLGTGFVAVPVATCLVLVPTLIFCNWNAYVHVVKALR